MSWHVRNVSIERFGAMEHRDVGPFQSGLNVVFGPNEAGKTTIASFIGGVLFGWDETRGVRNTYRPAEGSRAGSLEFARADSGGFVQAGDSSETLETTTLTRRENKDGLVGDAALVSDIDSNTFNTMFSLTSDELRSLRNSSDVTARLLTAGSGTGTSPAGAFVEIEQRIVEHIARNSDARRSVAHLSDLLEEKQAQIKAAAESVELSKQEHLELRELEDGRIQVSAHQDQLDRQLEVMSSCRAGLERVDKALERRSRESALLNEELAQIARDRGAQASVAQQAEPAGEHLASAHAADASPQAPATAGSGAEAAEAHSPHAHFSARLLALGAAEERALRDKLDELADEQAKAQRSVDVAKGESAASSASYEALLELDGQQPKRNRSTARIQQTLVPLLLTIAFIGAGVPLFMHGRSINSLSFTALGAGMVVFAVFMAIAAIAVLMRPDRSAEDSDRRLRDAQWVMLQDRKKLDASVAAKADFDKQLESFLAANGLEAAEGSVRHARSLLDDAREERARLASLDQRAASLELRLATAAEELAHLKSERHALEQRAGLPEGAQLEDIDQALHDLADQRDSVAAAREEMSRRIGELNARLEQARHDRTIDHLKLEYEQLRSQFHESRHELMVLLLARRMLEKSIVAWESRSQPEVYSHASRLFALITDGAWLKISMTAEGHLLAVSRTGEAREVRHLSLGTCQQLYLSLRVAMLLHARTVGRAVPVLADDILVNFDAERRRGAARVLAELASMRQVIVFTCHEETVEALRAACPGLTYLEL